VLMYLMEPEAGGETVFPNAGGQSECGGGMSTGLSVRPRKGDAVLFYTMAPGGKEDPSSIHGSCEVTKGEKWSATIWIRTGKFV
jgi:prolyl 4-hydroxylase